LSLRVTVHRDHLDRKGVISDIGVAASAARPLSRRHLTRLYARLARRKGHAKAIGAVARHLAEATYWMVTKQEAYREPIASRPTRLGPSRGASAVSP